ncbi:hypothetical protein ABK040_012525, partial [Willaertia magna]
MPNTTTTRLNIQSSKNSSSSSSESFPHHVKQGLTGNISPNGKFSYILTQTIQQQEQLTFIDNLNKTIISKFYNNKNNKITCCTFLENNLFIFFTNQQDIYILDILSGKNISIIKNLNLNILKCYFIQNNQLIITNNEMIGVIELSDDYKNLNILIQDNLIINKEIIDINYFNDLIFILFNDGEYYFYKIFKNNNNIYLNKVSTNINYLINNDTINGNITKIENYNDFCLLIGSKNNIIINYFTEYFKQPTIKQEIDIHTIFDNNLNIELFKIISLNKYSNLMIFKNNLQQLFYLIFDMNLWIKYDHNWNQSIYNPFMGNSTLLGNIYDVKYCNDQLIILTSRNIQFIPLLSTIDNNTQHDNNIPVDNNKFETFQYYYKESLYTYLVEYIQGITLNKQFITYNIQDISQWIKKEYKENEEFIFKILNEIISPNKNRTIPILEMNDIEINLNKYIHKIKILKLLINAMINRYKSLEEYSNKYISILLNMENKMDNLIEYTKICEWLLINELLPISANLYKYDELDLKWKEKRLQNTTLINTINSNNNLFIDKYIKLNNNIFLIDILLKDLNINYYPYKELNTFIEKLFLNDLNNNNYKHIVMFYFLIDYYSLQNINLNEKLNNYSKYFNLNNDLQQYAYGLYLFDNKINLQQSIYYLLKINLKHLDILKILLKFNYYHLANRFIYSSLNNLNDNHTIILITYLVNNMYHLAFQYYKKYNNNKLLFLIILDYIINYSNNQLLLLLSLHLNENEEQLLIEYLSNNNNTTTNGDVMNIDNNQQHPLLFHYFIMKHNYALAMKFTNDQDLLLSILPNVNTTMLLDNKMNIIINGMNKSIKMMTKTNKVLSKYGISGVNKYKEWLMSDIKQLEIPSIFDQHLQQELNKQKVEEEKEDERMNLFGKKKKKKPFTTNISTLTKPIINEKHHVILHNTSSSSATSISSKSSLSSSEEEDEEMVSQQEDEEMIITSENEEEVEEEEKVSRGMIGTGMMRSMIEEEEEERMNKVIVQHPTFGGKELPKRKLILQEDLEEEEEQEEGIFSNISNRRTENEEEEEEDDNESLKLM